MGEQMFAFPSDGAPGPVFAASDDAGAYRVVEDVLERVLVVLLVVDDPGREPLAEQRALAAEAGVVLAGVVALDPLDGAGEVFDPGVDDRVVVRPHQAVGVEPDAPTPGSLQEERGEGSVVVRVAEQPGLVNGVGRQVEVAVRQPSAKDSSHGSTLRLAARPFGCPLTSSPLSTRLRAPRRVSDTRRGPEGHGASGLGVLRGGRRSSASGRARGPWGLRRSCRSRGAGP